jgi:hypothetical protein
MHRAFEREAHLLANLRQHSPPSPTTSPKMTRSTS